MKIFQMAIQETIENHLLILLQLVLALLVLVRKVQEDKGQRENMRGFLMCDELKDLTFFEIV